MSNEDNKSRISVALQTLDDQELDRLIADLQFDINMIDTHLTRALEERKIRRKAARAEMFPGMARTLNAGKGSTH